MPAVAAAFSGGVMLWPAAGIWLTPRMVLALGVSAVLAAVLSAPRSVPRGDVLARIGVTVPAPAAVAAVSAERSRPRGSLPCAAALAIVGVVAIGCGWGGLHDARLDGQLLGSLAPDRVSIEGSLRTDPSPGSYGWSAVVDASRVGTDRGAWALRESLWVSGEGNVPRAVRGDRVLLEGTLRVPDDPGFAEALRRRGIVAELALDSFVRSGGASNPFLRATQVFRAFVDVRSVGCSRRRRPGCCSAWRWGTTRSSTRGSLATSMRRDSGIYSWSPGGTSRWCSARCSGSRCC
jgi:hypothetical protein